MFVDDYDIDSKFHQVKDLIEQLQPDVYKFIGSAKNKRASRRARKTLDKMIKTCIDIKKSILLQRQDNESEY